MVDNIKPAPILCPICGGGMEVRETRPGEGYIRRGRVCKDRTCDGRLSTIEAVFPTGLRTPKDPIIIGRERLIELRDLIDAVLGGRDSPST
jgi:hypothetical protein